VRELGRKGRTRGGRRQEGRWEGKGEENGDGVLKGGLTRYFPDDEGAEDGVGEEEERGEPSRMFGVGG